jgi:hypothetical protein
MNGDWVSLYKRAVVAYFKALYRHSLGKVKQKHKLLQAGPRRRREDNIKIDIKRAGCVDVNWINLAQDRGQWWDLVKTAMSLPIP